MPRQHETIKKSFTLAVVSQDHRFGKKVTDEARRRGLDAKFYSSMEEVPLSADAVVIKTDEYEIPAAGKIVPIQPGMQPASIVDKALEIGFGKKTVSKAVVVIDPGKKTGVAFFADEVLLRTQTYFDYELLADHVADFFNNHRCSEWVIYLGEGAPEFREQLIQHLTAKISKASHEIIKTVPEKGSSKLAGGKDEIAATIISRMRRQLKRS